VFSFFYDCPELKVVHMIAKLLTEKNCIGSRLVDKILRPQNFTCLPLFTAELQLVMYSVQMHICTEY